MAEFDHREITLCGQEDVRIQLLTNEALSTSYRSCCVTSALSTVPFVRVLSGSPSRGGEVAVYVFDINHPSLAYVKDIKS